MELREADRPEAPGPRPPAPEPSIETLPPPPPLPELLAIEIPLVDIDDGYVSRHLRVDPLTPRQARTLKRLTQALRGRGASCELRNRSDKLVEDTGHAVRWLFDAIADEEERRQ